MDKKHLTKTERQLQAVMGPQELRRLGAKTGFVQRERDITTVRFLSSLLCSLSTRGIESIADLQRDFNHDQNAQVHYHPYYDRMNRASFPQLSCSLFESMMSGLYQQVLEPLKTGPFSRFRDIILQDGTSFGLAAGLSVAFPGRFKTISPAAVEIHTTMSLFHDTPITATVTADKECERHYVPESESLRRCLFMADRGYDSTAMMDNIADSDGSFLIRIRKSLNPKVLKIRRRGERYRKLEGRLLSQVLRRAPKGKTLDLDVAWETDEGELIHCYRLVAQWNRADKEWTRLICNLDPKEFSQDQVLQAYRLRWQIELFFKELKSYSNLHRFSTTSKYIAEGLFWASLCAAFLKRYFAHSCQRICRTKTGISTRRVAMCSHTFMPDFFASILNGFRSLRTVLIRVFRFLTANAKRTNPKRERSKGRLAFGLRLVGVDA